MTREVKIGSAVAGSFLSLVGIVVGTKMYKGDIPKPAEGVAAAIEQVAKEFEAPKPVQQPNAPGTLPATFLSDTPLPAPSVGFPTPPSQPTPPPVDFSLPSVADVTKPFVDASNDVSKTLENKIREQEMAARNTAEKSKNDLLNSGNNLINGINQKIDGTTRDLTNQGNAAVNNLKDAANKTINDLPTFPDPSKLTLPPITMASDTTIVGGNNKPAAPKNDLPPPAPNFSGGSNPAIPAIPEVPPPTIVGGNPPPSVTLPGMPPSVPPTAVPIRPKDPAPSSFDNDIPKPPSVPQPPVGFPAVPNNGPTDPSSPPPVGNPFGSTPPPPAPTGQPPAIPVAPSNPRVDTPPSTIVSPNPNRDPMPPIPGPGSPFGSNTPTPPAPVYTPPTPPINSNPPIVPTVPGPPIDQFPTNPPTQPTGFAPLVPPASPTSVPLVKTDNPQQYIIQGNETFGSIAVRNYGNESYARALEAYNRDLPNASENVRAQPSRLLPGTVVWIPSQNYLANQYGRFIASAAPPLPPVSPVAPPVRPLGNEIGVSPPSPLGVRPPANQDNAGVTTYRVPAAGMYLSQVAERQLGSAFRWVDIYRLNPGLQPEQPLREGMEIRIPLK